MKELFKVTALSTLLLSSSTMLRAESENNFNYKYTDNAKTGATVTGIGLFSVAAAGVSLMGTVGNTSLDKGGLVTIGHILLRVGAGVSALGLVTLAYEGFSELKEIDKQVYLRDYAKLKAILNSALITGALPSNGDAQNLINSFTCESCDNDSQKIQRFSLVFNKIDQIAQDLVETVDFGHEELDRGINSSLVETSLRTTLGSDDTTENLKIAKRLLVLASVNALIVEEK